VITALLTLALVLIVVLGVFVVALLRSHAEIVRRLALIERGESAGAESQESAASRLSTVPADGERPSPIVGRTLAGDSVKVDLAAVSGVTLLAFLTSGCSACEPLWRELGEGATAPCGGRLLVIAKDLAEESPARLQGLVPRGRELLLSTQAWSDYAVPASPHFVLVDCDAESIVGRGSAGSWGQIVAIAEQALADVELASNVVREGERPGRPSLSTSGRAERAERALATSGIGPGHPSLYPAGAEGDEVQAV
jgi:hypothetical protein